MSNAGWIDELERDLGHAARLRLIANAGGQRRKLPSPSYAARSALAREVGADVATWLARRFRGGDVIAVPTARGHQRRTSASRLAAAVIEAGLTDPARSANAIAIEHGVSAAHVHRLRREMRKEAGVDKARDHGGSRQMRLFD